MIDLPQKKIMRLKQYDYSSNGAYFITICVKNRQELLGKINVGRDDSARRNPPQADYTPSMILSRYGNIVKRYIEDIENHYEASIDQYVIMPNHIHLIIIVENDIQTGRLEQIEDGVPGSSRPTMMIPNMIAVLKKMVNKEIGFDIWQTSYHDHVIRDEEDYQTHLRYIEENPAKWVEDEYYGGR